MKGDRSRCKGRGNKYSKGSKKCLPLGAAVQYVRPTKLEAELLESDLVIDAAMSSPFPKDDAHPVVKILRPNSNRTSNASKNETKDSEVNTTTDCNKLFHVGKLWEMINCVTRQHRESNPSCCGDLAFDPHREMQRGIVWREAVLCDSCPYKSEMFNLYKEVNTGYTTGRKAAAANVGINVALTQTPIAASSLTKILAGGNIKPPSKRGITHMKRKVRNTIISENKRDMSERIQQLKKINKLKGRPETHIAAEVDAVYNNSLYSGVGRTPFQPATQCTLTVCENLTPKKQIVAVETVNKLCSKSGFHTKDDDEFNIKSDTCSATASMETNIGNEEKWAEYCFEDLKHEGIEVKYLTSDGDGMACEGARCLFEQGITTVEPIQQLDTRHLGANH
ncbi:uncharacterized protein LOC123553351 [Mercenaria mercenaria]|uniref:uncharacterized protein LOC123553351 n=1 Tax=Mercenaria mercenaria TaxID=6596 RepID=UPI00234F9E43|nr:uncharacterized protein LOC123553351 [Mercenaria mercenaria]